MQCLYHSRCPSWLHVLYVYNKRVHEISESNQRQKDNMSIAIIVNIH